MALPHLALVPDADGYASNEGKEILAVGLSSGANVFRRGYRGATKTVNVKWTMNPTQYRYWRAFWETAIKRGALPFTCDLLSEDGSGPVAHTCSIIPESVSMPSQSGLTYIQTATLDVKPLPVDDVFNEEVIALFEYGVVDPDSLFNALAHLVLVKMPETISA